MGRVSNLVATQSIATGIPASSAQPLRLLWLRQFRSLPVSARLKSEGRSSLATVDEPLLERVVIVRVGCTALNSSKALGFHSVALTCDAYA
ncbi:unnamed protein product [Notodromas monacha]|uniref:Uncharacterized protein n=1 Tax=Notodromas monacha TaxID=399045 RepID=A0A7R9G7Z9_9CRUS|nr:unnamed protein product [Notodromas monacha]CAG0912591.1 unnamed protein product [Notodromas monacha]